MLPIGDDDRDRRLTPIVTYALIAANVLFFLVELNGGEAFIDRWAFVPSRFLANPVGDFATLFTSMFMHAGWAHLLGNMLYLWIFGDNVEDRLGHALYFVFYILCGLGATFAQMAISLGSSVANVGASGAIAGVLGAYFVLLPMASVLTIFIIVFFVFLREIPAMFFLGLWFIFQLWEGGFSILQPQAGGGVAFFAHIGGFAFGLATAYLMRRRRPLVPRW